MTNAVRILAARNFRENGSRAHGSIRRGRYRASYQEEEPTRHDQLQNVARGLIGMAAALALAACSDSPTRVSTWPDEPEQPAEPEQPTEPEQPAGPEQPIDPSPSEPEEPSEPIDPGPSEPQEPSEPIDPQPSETEEPSDPDETPDPAVTMKTAPVGHRWTMVRKKGLETLGDFEEDEGGGGGKPGRPVKPTKPTKPGSGKPGSGHGPDHHHGYGGKPGHGGGHGPGHEGPGGDHGDADGNAYLTRTEEGYMFELPGGEEVELKHFYEAQRAGHEYLATSVEMDGKVLHFTMHGEKADLVYSDYGDWETWGPYTGTINVGAWAIGMPTEDMPTAGTAKYRGGATAKALYGATALDFKAQAELTANFAENTVAGEIGDLKVEAGVEGISVYDLHVTFRHDIGLEGSIHGNSFKGKATVLDAVDASPEGRFGGHFYGPDAAEAAGTFKVRYPTVTFGDLDIIGSFGLRRAGE